MWYIEVRNAIYRDMNPLICGTEIPSFLIFDFSTAPTLLFYTYVPVIIISVFLGAYVFSKDRHSLPSRLLFGITSFFALWVLDILVLWVTSYNDVLHFAWQLTPVFEVPIFIFSVCFSHVVTDKNHADIPRWLKSLCMGIMAAVFLLLPTTFNITSYDLDSCEGVPGFLFYLMYFLEVVAIIYIIMLGIFRYRSTKDRDAFSGEIMFTTCGIVAFLSLFFGSNIIGQITRIQQISFIGSLGMVSFLAFLVYTIVRFQIFKLRLLGTRAILVAMVVAISSTLFVVRDFHTMRVVIAITIILFSILAFFFDKMANELDKANKGQKYLLSVISHGAKNFLYRAWIGYGKLARDKSSALEQQKYAEEREDDAMRGNKLMVATIAAVDFDKGALRFELEKIDLVDVVRNQCAVMRRLFERKGIEFAVQVPTEQIMVDVDETALSLHVVFALLENAWHYTASGSVRVVVEKIGDRAIFSVSDTGKGISRETMRILFTKGGHDARSRDDNPESTGNGMYLAKGIVERFGGHISASSPGDGKGAVFTVDLPLSG